MWQFTIWWRWSAMLASNRNNIILANKKGMQFTMLSSEKIPSSLRSRALLPRESLKEKAAGEQNRKETVLVLGCKTVSYCWNQKVVQLSNNRHSSIQFLRFRVGLKTFMSVELWDHCYSWERQQNRCTQGVLLFTWPTALAWETIHVLRLHGLDCGSVAFNVLSKLQ